MPELPEVETTRRGIEPWVVDRRITGWTVRNPALRWPVEIPEDYRNQTVAAVLRRGKYLLLRSAPGTLIVHLGMSGSLRVLPAGADPRKHDHVDLCLDNSKILRLNDPRRFGCVLYQPGPDPERHWLLEHLGVEPLGNEFSGRYLHRISRNRKVAVKNFIMDSHVVVGVGNIYANEALFMAGIHPARAAGRVALKRYVSLAETIKTVLHDAITQGGTTLRDFVGGDGSPGYFAQQLRVYGRQGQPCRACKSVLKEIRQSGRSTVFCPGCQR